MHAASPQLRLRWHRCCLPHEEHINVGVGSNFHSHVRTTSTMRCSSPAKVTLWGLNRATHYQTNNQDTCFPRQNKLVPEDCRALHYTREAMEFKDRGQTPGDMHTTCWRGITTNTPTYIHTHPRPRFVFTQARRCPPPAPQARSRRLRPRRETQAQQRQSHPRQLRCCRRRETESRRGLLRRERGRP